MKGFSRAIAAILLSVLLFSFCVWRYEKLDLISDATAYLSGALDRFEQMIVPFEPHPEDPDTGNGGENQTPSSPYDPNGNYSDYRPGESVNVSVQEALRTGLLAMQPTIDLSAASATKAEVKNAMASLIYSEPELFYLQSQYEMTFVGDRVTALTPKYTCTPSELETKRAEYRAALDAIVAGAPIDGSEFDKILYLHDYFVANYTYDTELSIRDAHTLFTQGKGVCQAYMLGLIAAARELGLECTPVTSDTMMHAWNLVKIDGAWYHVDVTWDDVATLPTQACYTYFLQSDAGLTAIDADLPLVDRHREWAAAVSAQDPTYDQAAFRGAQTPILKQGDVYYCVAAVQDMSGGVRGEILSGTSITAMAHFADVRGGYWVAQGNRFYTDCYSDLIVHDGYLYYHSGNSISRIPLSGGASQTVHLAVGLSGTASIYGFLGIADGGLQYILADSPIDTTYRTAVWQMTP
ncbi:MAG: hypothetical protein IJW51_03010 [Clostridia bacterium]|nr:hypothetical protein [Clostridia bacterium]